uniref:30 kDa salivary antigen family protein n=1 Tax=Anopheles funestus TaxID=62324 RepID=Q06DJ5_ANOFN|nr:30 kDa salivary antigen family protein [Anopheles funestus]
MKSLLLLASVLCLALIVSARPSDETPDQETSTELSEDTSADDTQEEETVDTGAESDADSESGADAESGGDASETEDGTGESEASPDEEHTDEKASDDGEGTDDTKDEDTEGHDDASEEGADGEGAGEDQQGGGEGGEESPRNTYRQVHKLLKNIMKVGTKDKYLKSFVLARLQERLMNPTIDLISSVQKYSKIKECFSSLAKDVGSLVKESDKSYEECSKDKSNPNCGSEGTRELDEGLIEREQELSDCIVEKRDSE